MIETLPQAPVANFDPNRINTIDPARVRFPERFSLETLTAPKNAVVTLFEGTLEGFMELELEYTEVERAVNLDFYHLAATTLTRPQLEERAAPALKRMNQQRASLETPIDPLETAALDDRFLRHLVRPDWRAYAPQDTSEASVAKWEQFKLQYPENLQINLEELQELDGKMRVLSTDKELCTEVQGMHAERIGVMRMASAFLAADRKLQSLSRREVDIYRAAASSNRSMTTAEQRHLRRLGAQRSDVQASKGRGITSYEILEQVKGEVQRRINIQRRRDFEKGLVMTSQMELIINELLPSLASGRPALLVGETGGAKTALAEYISRNYFGKEPEFVSGYGDVNSYQLMGKMSLTEKDGATVSEFVPGPIIRAMEHGKPLILDEINAMPPEFIKRLNKIIQMRPGDRLIVQEDSGRQVTIKPGFMIIATANEKSKRYKGIDDLSVEFQNRFGANVVRIAYPDSDVVYGEAPIDNTIIARAALTDRSGQLLAVDTNELERFVRACHVSQQVFSGNFGAGFSNYSTTENIRDKQPGLAEAVLAPRTMVALLEKVRDSYGRVSLEQTVQRFVSGIKLEADRRVMTIILQGYGFLTDDRNT